MRTCLIVTLVLLVLLMLLTGIGAVLLYRAARQVPEFYAEAIEAPTSVEREASEAMVQRVTALASDVQEEGEWESLFLEEQINGWLAVDLKENYPTALPPEFSEPRLAIEPERIVLACRVALSSFSGVVSLEVEPYLAEHDVLALRIHGAHAGRLPLPLNRVLEGFTAAAQRAHIPLRWQQSEGDPVALVPIGALLDARHKDISVEKLRLSDGQIYFSGRTQRR